MEQAKKQLEELKRSHSKPHSSHKDESDEEYEYEYDSETLGGGEHNESIVVLADSSSLPKKSSSGLQAARVDS